MSESTYIPRRPCSYCFDVVEQSFHCGVSLNDSSDWWLWCVPSSRPAVGWDGNSMASPIPNCLVHIISCHISLATNSMMRRRSLQVQYTFNQASSDQFSKSPFIHIVLGNIWTYVLISSQPTAAWMGNTYNEASDQPLNKFFFQFRLLCGTDYKHCDKDHPAMFLSVRKSVELVKICRYCGEAF